MRRVQEAQRHREKQGFQSIFVFILLLKLDIFVLKDKQLYLKLTSLWSINNIIFFKNNFIDIKINIDIND